MLIQMGGGTVASSIERPSQLGTGQDQTSNQSNSGQRQITNNTSSSNSTDLNDVIPGSEVDINQLTNAQKMVIASEPDAQMSISVNGGAAKEVPNGSLNSGYGREPRAHEVINLHPNQSTTIVINYKDLQHSSYNDQPIKSARYTFSDFQYFPDINNPYIGFYNNPNDGFNYQGLKSFRVKLEYFKDDAMTQPIDFDSHNTYLTFASLNHNSLGHVEAVRAVDNTGTGLTLPGSTIKYHQDGWMNADESNEGAAWIDPTSGNTRTDNWDSAAEGAYVGTAVIQVHSSTPVVEFKMDRGSSDNTYVWSTIKSKVPLGITPVTDNKLTTYTETVHYKYSDGNQANSDKVNKVTGYLHGVSINGEPKWSSLVDENGNEISYPEVDSPEIKGYTPDKTSVAKTPATKDEDVTVTYTKNDPTTVSRTKIITETVHYKYSDGTTAKPDVQKTVTLTQTGSKDPVTDKITWGEWSTDNYPKVDSPTIKGYTPDKTSVAKTPATKDEDVTVTYTKNDSTTVSRTKTITETVHYKYSDGTTAKPDVQKTVTLTQIGSKDPVTDVITWGDWSTDNYPEVNSPAIKGYTPDKTSVAQTPATGDKEETVTYTKNETEPVNDNGITTENFDENSVTSNNTLTTGDNRTSENIVTPAAVDEVSEKVTTSSSKNVKHLPQTGNENEKSLLALGFASALFGLFGFRKKKEN